MFQMSQIRGKTIMNQIISLICIVLYLLIAGWLGRGIAEQIDSKMCSSKFKRGLIGISLGLLWGLLMIYALFIVIYREIWK